MIEEGKLTSVLMEVVEKSNIVMEEVEYPAKTRIFHWNDWFVIQKRVENPTMDEPDFWDITVSFPEDVEEYILGKKFELTKWDRDYPPNPWKSLD